MSNLAPGYRFYPTEEELIGFYLRNKLEKRRDDLDRVIPVYDIYSLDPWQLPSWHLFLLPTPTSSFASFSLHNLCSLFYDEWKMLGFVEVIFRYSISAFFFFLGLFNFYR